MPPVSAMGGQNRAQSLGARSVSVNSDRSGPRPEGPWPSRRGAATNDEGNDHVRGGPGGRAVDEARGGSRETQPKAAGATGHAAVGLAAAGDWFDELRREEAATLARARHRALTQRYFVYALVDPRDGLPRYIGRSTSPHQRFLAHLGRKTENIKKRAWVKELRQLKLQPLLRIILEVVGIDAAEREEKSWTAAGRRRGWPLVGRAGGGSIGVGYRMTREAIGLPRPKELVMKPINSAAAAMEAGLTFRQFEVLEVIAESVETNGFPPTIREIGDALDISSTNGVNDHLKALERKGCVTRAEMRGRTLRVTPTGVAAIKAWRARILGEAA